MPTRLFLLIPLMFSTTFARADQYASAIEAALNVAGDNAPEIQNALDGIDASRQEGIRFLIANMPERDLQSLTSDFLIENVNVAYDAFESAVWRDKVPSDVFLNDILPYASVNENRDPWRKDFYERFQPLVGDLKDPGQVAAMLNNKIFPLLKVKYSTKRRRADQGPFESIESGLASCTGLSVLLIDACRSVGVPARFAGTPLWSDRSGNHSWVEVWDDGWHFTGAAEPAGDALDKAWFLGRASGAKRDHRLHAIYAVSYRKTPITFPLVWDRRIDYVHAVNVTDRYANAAKELPEGFKYVMFRAFSRSGERCCAKVRVEDNDGKVVFEGETNDERFDANDHLTTSLKRNGDYKVILKLGTTGIEKTIRVSDDFGDRQLFSFTLAKVDDSAKQLRELSNKQLTKAEGRQAKQLLLDEHRQRILDDRKEEMENRSIQIDKYAMPFFYEVYGDKPPGGRSMYISMHGGGGAPKRVNDRQWNNQKRLYKPDEGVYIAPRGPTDTWDLWHQAHIDGFFDRLIENMIAFEDVNPNRVYLMGYSAGGDGAYQLAPRMADRWAAAAMMAGHPNDASPLGLRNIGFTIFMGGLDSAYNRNKVAAEWKEKLAALRTDDPNGYEHLVTIYPDKGHWMDGEDASAIPWMSKHTRNPLPKKIVWMQDDVTQPRFYWLRVDEDNRKKGGLVVAKLDGQSISLDVEGIKKLYVRLNDTMMDLDQPVTISVGNEKVFQGRVDRTIEVLRQTVDERGDPSSVFAAEVAVEVK